MKIYTTNHPHEALTIAQKLLNGEEGLIRYIGDNGVFVLSGQLPTFDEGFCKRFGLTVGKTVYLGGTIVDFPGDLELCDIRWGLSDFGEQVINAVLLWLQTHDINACLDGNDMMVDNKKVASFAQTMLANGWVETVIHFSVSSDVRLIRSICTKPMRKIPGALSEFGLDADTIWNILVDSDVISVT